MASYCRRSQYEASPLWQPQIFTQGVSISANDWHYTRSESRTAVYQSAAAVCDLSHIIFFKKMDIWEHNILCMKTEIFKGNPV
jgi:hypothetical protein